MLNANGKAWVKSTWVKVKRTVTVDNQVSEQVGGGESETPVKGWL